MNAGTTTAYNLALTAEERNTLLNILEEVLRETLVEEHRAEAFGARQVVRAREAAIESLLRKVRETNPA